MSFNSSDALSTLLGFSSFHTQENRVYGSISTWLPQKQKQFTWDVIPETNVDVHS